MTNEEKNEKRINELGLGELSTKRVAEFIAVRKNGDLVLCSNIACCDCIFKCGSCYKETEDWLKSEAESEKSEPDKIKVGDTVKVTKKSCAEEGKIGLVKELFSISADGVKTYRVRFNGTFSECVFFENEFEKVKTKKTPPRIVVYRDGDTVTAKDLETGEKASAVCSKDDTFDFHTGAFIAVSRLTHFEDDIKMMRLETEQIEEDIADMKMRFGALMGEGYKYPEGFTRKEEENEA